MEAGEGATAAVAAEAAAARAQSQHAAAKVADVRAQLQELLAWRHSLQSPPPATLTSPPAGAGLPTASGSGSATAYESAGGSASYRSDELGRRTAELSGRGSNTGGGASVVRSPEA